MEDYLRFTKDSLADLGRFSKIHGILGNPTCDLDSVVSALTYGLYLHSIQSEGETTLFLPIVAIPSDEFNLRTEVTYFLSKLDLNFDLLTFRNEIDLAQLHSEGKLELTLVDHNVLPSNDSILENSVTMVIDHRTLERSSVDNVEIVVDTVGSCSTLIGDILIHNPLFNIDEKTATLLYGTILIDTINRSPEAAKTKPKDEAVLAELELRLPGVDGDALFNEIFKAKFDISGLTNTDIFMKDTKMINNNNMTIAMVSITMQLPTLLGRPNFVTDLASFCQSHNAHVAVIMTLAMDGSHVERQLAVYSENRIFRQQIADLLDNCQEPILQLDPMLTPEDNLLCFTQGNVTASRKHVLPVLKEFLTGEATPGIDTGGFQFGDFGNQDFANNLPQTSIKDSFNHDFSSELETEQNQTDPFGLFSSGGEAIAESTTLSSSNPFSNNGASFDDFFTSGNSNTNQPTSRQHSEFDEFDPFTQQAEPGNSAQNPMDAFIDNLLSSNPSSQPANELTMENSFSTQRHGLASGEESPMNFSSGGQSGGSSYPVTPPNSFLESNMENFARDHNLPSFNSSEMVKIIKDRQASMEQSEAIPEADESETFPFTPRNSYQISPLESSDKHYDLPHFHGEEMLQKILEKRASLGDSTRDFDSNRGDSLGEELQGALFSFGEEGGSSDGQTVIEDSSITSGDNGVEKVADSLSSSNPFSDDFDSETETKLTTVADNLTKDEPELPSLDEPEKNDLISDNVIEPSELGPQEISRSPNSDIESDFSSETSAVQNFEKELQQQYLSADQSLQSSDNIVAQGLAKDMADSNPFSLDNMVSQDSDVGKNLTSDTTESYPFAPDDYNQEGTQNLSEAVKEAVNEKVFDPLIIDSSMNQPLERDPSVENVQDFMPEVDRSVITPEKEVKPVIGSSFDDSVIENSDNSGESQNVVAENLSQEMQQTDSFSESQNVVAENLSQEMQQADPVEESQNVVAENLSQEMQQADPFGESQTVVAENLSQEMQQTDSFSESQNVVAENLALEMQQTDPFGKSQNVLAENLVQEMQQADPFGESQNVVAENLSQQMQQTDPFGESQTVVAENLSQEMQQTDSFSESQNVVAENLALEMQQTDPFGKSQNVLAENLVQEMQQADPFGESQNVVAENLSQQMQQTDPFGESQNVVAENLSQEMQETDLFGASQNVVAENLSQEMQQANLFGESQNVVAKNLAQEMQQADPFAESQNVVAENLNQEMQQADAFGESQNVVAENLSQEMQQTDPFGGSQNVLAENLAQEMQKSDPFGGSQNVVAENLSQEMQQTDPFGESQNVVAENLAQEMQQGDPFGESQNVVAENLSQEMQQADPFGESQNVVAENLSQEMQQGDPFGESQNVVADNLSQEIQQADPFGESQNVVAENLSQEMQETDPDEESQNVVAENLSREMQQADSFSESQNVVAENLSQEMQQTDPVEELQNVVAENLSQEMQQTDPVEESQNVVAENLSQEMQQADPFGATSFAKELSIENVQDFLPEVERAAITPDKETKPLPTERQDGDTFGYSENAVAQNLSEEILSGKEFDSAKEFLHKDDDPFGSSFKQSITDGVSFTEGQKSYSDDQNTSNANIDAWQSESIEPNSAKRSSGFADDFNPSFDKDSAVGDLQNEPLSKALLGRESVAENVQDLMPEVDRIVLTPDKENKASPESFSDSVAETKPDYDVDDFDYQEKEKFNIEEQLFGAKDAGATFSGAPTSAVYSSDEIAEDIIQKNIEDEYRQGLTKLPGEPVTTEEQVPEVVSDEEGSFSVEQKRNNFVSGLDNLAYTSFDQSVSKNEMLVSDEENNADDSENDANDLGDQDNLAVSEGRVESLGKPAVRFAGASSVSFESGTGNESEDIMLSDDESFEEGYKGTKVESGAEVQIAQKFAEEIISEACEIVSKDQTSANSASVIPKPAAGSKGLSRSELARQMMEADQFDSEESSSGTPSATVSPEGAKALPGMDLEDPSSETFLTQGNLSSDNAESPSSEAAKIPSFEPSSNNGISEITLSEDLMDNEEANSNKNLEEEEALSQLNSASYENVDKFPTSPEEEVKADELSDRDISLEEIKPEDLDSSGEKFTDVEIAQAIADNAVLEAVEHLTKEQQNIAEELADAMAESEEEINVDQAGASVASADLDESEDAKQGDIAAHGKTSEAGTQNSDDTSVEFVGDLNNAKQGDIAAHGKTSEAGTQNSDDTSVEKTSAMSEVEAGTQVSKSDDNTVEFVGDLNNQFKSDDNTVEFVGDLNNQFVEEWNDVAEEVEPVSVSQKVNVDLKHGKDDLTSNSNESNTQEAAELSDLSPEGEEIVREIAYDMAEDIIQKALETFPTPEGEMSTSPSTDDSPNKDMSAFEPHMKRSHEMCPVTAADDNTREEKSFSLPVETEYLPSIDPLRGNLDIVTSPVQTVSTDANKEVAENIGFKQMSIEQFDSSPSDEETSSEHSQIVNENESSSQIHSKEEAVVEETISTTTASSAFAVPDTGNGETDDIHSSQIAEKESVDKMLEKENFNSMQEELEGAKIAEIDDVKSDSTEKSSSEDSDNLVQDTTKHLNVTNVLAVKSDSTEKSSSEDSDNVVQDTTKHLNVTDALAVPVTGRRKKEIYMTTAGRISISTDTALESDADTSVSGSYVASQLEERIAEESRQQVGEMVASAESVIVQVDDKLSEDFSQTGDVSDEDFLSRKTRSALAEAMEDEDDLENDLDDDLEDEDEGQTDLGSRVVPIETEVRLRGEEAESSDTIPKSARPNTLLMFPGTPKQKIHPNIRINEDEDSEDDKSLSSSDLDLFSGSSYVTTPDIATPDTLIADSDWGSRNNLREDTPVASPAVEAIPEYTAAEELRDGKSWRRVVVGDQEFTIDMKVVEPYKRVLSHGGYYGDDSNAIVVFSGCYLPDRNRKDYSYVMEHLFFYVISTLELLVAEDYMIVYFHGATPRRQMPSFGWLKRCYQMIDRRLKKNLKGLLLVHPTLWIKTVVMMSRPFISSKFSSKLKMVKTLADLEQLVPMEYVFIPDQVKEYDERRYKSSSVSTPSTPSSAAVSPR